jgi:hypothetical protein
VLEDPAKASAEHLIEVMTINTHERMDEADDREIGASGVGDRSPATIGVPAEDGL